MNFDELEQYKSKLHEFNPVRGEGTK